MNTIIVCGFILLIAIVGSIYFAVQDKKEKKAPAIWLQVLFFSMILNLLLNQDLNLGPSD